MGPGAGNVSPLQSAIQFLSLRLPRVTGAQGIAPQALMQSPGGGGFPSPILQALLRLAGLQGGPGAGPQGFPGQPMAPPMMGQGTAPMAAPRMPRIIPGYQDRQRGPGVPTFPVGAEPVIDLAGLGVQGGGYGGHITRGGMTQMGLAGPLTGGVVDRRNPGVGNRGTTAPRLSAGPVAKRPFSLARQGFQRQY